MIASGHLRVEIGDVHCYWRITFRAWIDITERHDLPSSFQLRAADVLFVVYFQSNNPETRSTRIFLPIYVKLLLIRITSHYMLLVKWSISKVTRATEIRSIVSFLLSNFCVLVFEKAGSPHTWASSLMITAITVLCEFPDEKGAPWSSTAYSCRRNR